MLMLTSKASILQLLLDAGAAVNTRDSMGNTVLHAFAQSGYSAGILCCLLKAGADATATDTTGSAPAAVALAHGHTVAAALLQRAEADQRSKQQQQQRAAPLPVDRQILHGWQSSIDMSQRLDTVKGITDYLGNPEGEQWRSDYIELIALVEFELYRRAANITAYSDVSTLRRRLIDLLADGVILQTQLKQGVELQTVAAAIVQPSADKAAVSKPADAEVINREASAQQPSHAAHDSGDSDSSTDTSATGSSSYDVQQQQQQQQQQ